MNGKYVIWHTGYIKGIDFAKHEYNNALIRGMFFEKESFDLLYFKLKI